MWNFPKNCSCFLKCVQQLKNLYATANMILQICTLYYHSILKVMRADSYHELPVGVVASISCNQLCGVCLIPSRYILLLFGDFFALYMGRPSRSTPVRAADCLPQRAAHIKAPKRRTLPNQRQLQCNLQTGACSSPNWAGPFYFFFLFCLIFKRSKKERQMGDRTHDLSVVMARL